MKELKTSIRPAVYNYCVLHLDLHCVNCQLFHSKVVLHLDQIQDSYSLKISARIMWALEKKPVAQLLN